SCAARRCASLFVSSVCRSAAPLDLHSFPTRRSSDLLTALRPPLLQRMERFGGGFQLVFVEHLHAGLAQRGGGHPLAVDQGAAERSEEHTSELQSRENLVCRLLLEKKKRGTVYAGLQT